MGLFDAGPKLRPVWRDGPVNCRHPTAKLHTPQFLPSYLPLLIFDDRPPAALTHSRSCSNHPVSVKAPPQVEGEVAADTCHRFPPWGYRAQYTQGTSPCPHSPVGRRDEAPGWYRISMTVVLVGVLPPLCYPYSSVVEAPPNHDDDGRTGSCRPTSV